jgi:hypothetical protein
MGHPQICGWRFEWRGKVSGAAKLTRANGWQSCHQFSKSSNLVGIIAEIMTEISQASSRHLGRFLEAIVYLRQLAQRIARNSSVS